MDQILSWREMKALGTTKNHLLEVLELGKRQDPIYIKKDRETLGALWQWPVESKGSGRGGRGAGRSHRSRSWQEGQIGLDLGVRVVAWPCRC